MSKAQNTHTAHESEHGTTTSYVVGFILSLVFTFIPYYLVVEHVFSGLTLAITILGFAVIQMIIQIVFFLHIGREKGPRWQLLFFLSTIGIILVVVVASQWIMNHLHYNMSPVTPDGASKKLVEGEGIYQIGGEKTGACKGVHTTYKVVLQDGAMSPNHVDAKLCDKITFVNEDDKTRYIMFGSYDEPRAYGGEDMLTVRNGRPKTVVLNELGTHEFHDHANPDAVGGFTVAP